MISDDSISSTQIRQLLKGWDSTARLGMHPLAQLTCVSNKMKLLGHAETEVGRGMALKEILHEAIQTLRPNDSAPETHDKAWYAYLIITERYCFGRLPEWIMVHLSISERSFYREMKLGTETIVSFLRHAEHLAQTVPSNPLLIEPTQSAPLLPPSLPQHLIVGRETLLTQVAAKLTGAHGQKVALHGLPGAGKTTIASILIDQKELVEYFTDGIIWINIGPKPDLALLLVRLATQIGLTDVQIRKSTSHSLPGLIRTQLADKKQLFIIDDVWQIEAAESICLGGRQTAYLITTRLPAIGIQFAGPSLFTVPELDHMESQSLLNHLTLNVFENEPDALQTLQEVTGGLPLGLVIFGRYLHMQGYHGQQQRLSAAIERLKQRNTRLNLDNQRTNQKSLSSVIGTSLENLSAAAQQAFQRLTIFQPKPNSFSLGAAFQVAACSADAFYELVDGGLIESLGRDRFALHQLIHDYALPDKHDSSVIEALLHFAATYAATHRFAFNQLQIEQNNIQAALEFAWQYGQLNLAGAVLFSLIDYLLDRGQIEQADLWVKEGQALIDGDPQRAANSHLLYCQGRIADRQNRPNEALKALDQAGKLAHTVGLTDVMLRSQVAAMQLNLRQGDLSQAKAQAEAVQNKIVEFDDLIWQGKAHQSLCGFYYFQGDYQQAFKHIALTRQRFEATGFTAGMGAVYQNLGVLALELGRLDSAAANYERALTHYRTAGNKNFEGQILNNMGILAVRKGQWIKGLQFHQQALNLRQEIEDQDGQGQSLNNLSVVALAQKDVAQAKHFVEKGMALAKLMGTRFREASLYMSQATLATIQRDYEGGLAYAQKAHAIAKELQRESTLSEAATDQGRLHMFLHEYDNAEKWLTIGREMVQSNELTHQLAMNNVYLAKLFGLQNDVRQAESYLEEALVYLDHTVDGLDDPVEILQMCFDVLDQINDEKRASVYKQKAILTLKQQSLQIEDLAVRDFYLNTYREAHV